LDLLLRSFMMCSVQKPLYLCGVLQRAAGRLGTK
jgi:hypothetical protein